MRVADLLLIFRMGAADTPLAAGQPRALPPHSPRQTATFQDFPKKQGQSSRNGTGATQRRALRPRRSDCLPTPFTLATRRRADALLPWTPTRGGTLRHGPLTKTNCRNLSGVSQEKRAVCLERKRRPGSDAAACPPTATLCLPAALPPPVTLATPRRAARHASGTRDPTANARHATHTRGGTHAPRPPSPRQTAESFTF